MTPGQRLRNDFRLALLALFSAIVMLGVTPFAIYRFVSGDWLAGIVDMVIVLCIGLISGYAWRSGDVDRAGLLLSLTCSAGCIVVASLLGLAGALWMYPVLLGNFLLISRDRALAVSTVSVLGLALTNPAFTDVLEPVMFVVTAGVVSLFAYIFAARAEWQRQQLEAAAVIDPLTGAFNRRGLAAELDIAIEASIRNERPLGLAVFDLDHFKQINDRYGHEAGDEVLVQFANVVRRSTRKGDRFFRLGGEEFALLLPGADAESLRAVCEYLRATVQNEVRRETPRVTISIGATPLAPGESASTWLSRADAAMYRAKREGRNCVVVEDLSADSTVRPLMRYQPAPESHVPGCG